MNELQLPLCAFFFSALLCIVFFSKERLNLIENKLYSVMIVTGLLDSIIIILERILVISGNINDVTPTIYLVLQITNKLDFLVLIILTTCAFLYTLLITYPKVKPNINKWIKSTFLLDAIVYLIILFSDVHLITYNNIISVSGSAIVITYVLGGLYLIISMLMAIINIKRLTRRHIPIMSAIFMFTFLIFIFRNNPYIMVISIIIAFANYLMYFTIENPDIKMIDELTKAKTLVEKNNNDKSIFIFNTTQQIRNPLNMIEQKTEQILDYNLEEEVKEKVLDIRTCEQRISYILRGIMDVSTIDAKNIKIVNNQYKIGNILTEIKIRAKKEAEKKGLEFRTSIDEGMPEELYGDSIRLKQIINGIVSNAIKYTDKGFVELDVNSIVSFDICRLIISVKDSGIGVNADKINKLFQSKEDIELDKVEGSDITLEVAKKMINLIGGTITVRSERGRGSEFTIIVDQKIKTEENKIKDIVDEYKNLNNKKKIMIVTDNDADRASFIKKIGDDVNLVFAMSGQECLEKIRNKENFDLIIIKEKMDKLDALKTITKLNDIKGFSTKVIIMTDSVETSKKLNMHGYDTILNNISSSELKKIIK
mgnify:FL=1